MSNLEREKFEKWYVRKSKGCMSYIVMRMNWTGSNYNNLLIQSAWSAWQAAKQDGAARIESLECAIREFLKADHDSDLAADDGSLADCHMEAELKTKSKLRELVGE